jgi:hypothetical protein
MINDSTRVERRTGRAWPPPARTAAAIVAAAAVALLAACGGSGPGGTPNAGGASSSQALAYSQCMRSHGLRSFPDPDSHGVLPKVGPDQLGISPSQFQAADGACAHLLQRTQAQTAQLMSGMRDFAQCMRSHGVQSWPDPTTGSNGQPVFNIPGIDPNSPQIQAKADGCFHLVPQSPRGPTTIELCGAADGQPPRPDGDTCHSYGASNS